jgi:hypothetical protein
MKDVAPYSQQQYLEQREFERKQKILDKTGDDPMYGVPRITQQAAMLIREGSASDRLYEESFRITREKEKPQEPFSRPHSSASVSPKVGEISHSINFIARCTPIFISKERR